MACLEEEFRQRLNNSEEEDVVGDLPRPRPSPGGGRQPRPRRTSRPKRPRPLGYSEGDKRKTRGVVADEGRVLLLHV
ncbi:hypothetical protein TRIUR3_32814 [Triticum urartu]|uniref:Uncharacterized protein n=1 Tax=Triticum urartu TaxID=4572 RepID=M8A0C6_TRIUA|nr:hypothetical protein TRIUR3_32814 [Triticum urartu]